MQKSILLIAISLLFITSHLCSQESSTPSESRKKNIKELLDYRYRGGFYSFERLFFKTVEYPEYAKKNCIIGIMIVRFEVDCEGVIKNLVIKNPLRWGLDAQVQNFLQLTTGNWNKCNDDKYTRFEVPIQFTINDTETNATDGMIILQAELVGYKCKGDSYYQEKLDNALEKNSRKKALKYVGELIKRDPYNANLYDIRKELIDKKK